VVNNAARQVLAPAAVHDRMRSGELVSASPRTSGRVLDALVALTTTLMPDLLLVASIVAVLATLDVEPALVGLSVVPALA
jgi:ATP-binding cassette subfamily B protein